MPDFSIAKIKSKNFIYIKLEISIINYFLI